MASPFRQELQDYDWLALSLSLRSSSASPPPPHLSPFQYTAPSCSLSPSQLRAPPPSPSSPRPSPFQYIPLPPPPPQPAQLVLLPHYQQPYIPAPPSYPPYTPSQEHNNNELLLKCEHSSQESNPRLEVPAQNSSQESNPRSDAGTSRRARASSSNPPAPRAVRRRREVRSETIPPPFPWATPKRAIVYSLEHLRSQGLTAITGTVVCKRCGEQRDITFDLEEKFNEVARFIEENKFDLHDRAPESWNHPVFPTCERCGTENSLKPVITKKRSINWLFLLLGQWIGCCKLEQLKYFCKHAMNHRTGAKDRLLYSTYLGLCKQLHPEGPYD